MHMRLWIASLLLSAGSAHAEHDHTVEHGGDKRAFGAGVSMVAASFDTMFYVGNYQGIMPAVHYTYRRFAIGANTALYRVEKNGGRPYGFGDAIVHGQYVFTGERDVAAGVSAAMSVPIGDDQRGLGMGHPMLMPALFGSAKLDEISVAGSIGYSRAIGGHRHHDHGQWPLVDPMNLSELTWSAGGDVAITRGVHSGLRMSGGMPIGEGEHRIVGAVRTGWTNGRFSTAAELQAGLSGNPFTVRGVLSTAMSF